MMGEVKSRWHEELWASLALFCCMYYIISLNAQILSKIGIPVSATITATFAVIILFNISGALSTGTGLIIAPAIGLSTFVVNFVHSMQKSMTFAWPDALLGCFIGGAILAATSFAFPLLRDRLINEMPDAVKRGAKAAIGTLLSVEAFDMFKDFVKHDRGLDPNFAFWSVAISTSVILLFFLLRNSSRPKSDLHHFLLRSEFLLIVLLMSVALHFFQPDYIRNLPQTTSLSILWLDPALQRFPNLNGAQLILDVMLALFIWFIVVTDIPGTPTEVLPKDWDAQKRERAKINGYKNDAVAALLSPVFGTTTTIYYAENQILNDFQVFSDRVGYFTVLWFVIVLACVLLGPSVGISHSIEWYLPPLAVLPPLLAIGLYIVAISFMDKIPQPQNPAAKADASHSAENYFPAAIAVVLTPYIGLEYSFPIAILSYWCGKRRDHGSSFIGVTAGSIVALVIILLSSHDFRADEPCSDAKVAVAQQCPAVPSN